MLSLLKAAMISPEEATEVLKVYASRGSDRGLGSGPSLEQEPRRKTPHVLALTWTFSLPHPCCNSGGATSALELLEAQRSARRIVTFCSDLDRALGGGVSTGHVTEFCGVSAPRRGHGFCLV